MDFLNLRLMIILSSLLVACGEKEEDTAAEELAVEEETETGEAEEAEEE